MRSLPLLLVGLLATGAGRRASADVVEAADLSAAERDAVGKAFDATVRLATAPEGFRPPDDAAEASGVVVTPDGVVATTARYVERVGKAPGRIRLFARVGSGRWEAATVVARVPFADLGVVRLKDATPRTPLAAAPAAKSPDGRVLAAVLGTGDRVELRAAPIGALEWFDPTVVGGRAESKRSGPGRPAVAGSFPTALRVGEALASRALEGTPVVDREGRCVGIVTRVDADRPAQETVVVRPADLWAPWAASVAATGGFSVADLGVTLSPAPSLEPVAATALPRDLAALREGGKERGGALVERVDLAGPAANVLWPGDLVLEVDGEALFGEIAETHARAMRALHAGVPSTLTLWRGKREKVTVTPRTPR
ncbi:MAG: trypsin-like peptidase domain-containing protein [Planctomycetes bacterium]|nr:trypsin-like peptidase domain-containing protein [Planctomycetota bacterium]